MRWRAASGALPPRAAVCGVRPEWPAGGRITHLETAIADPYTGVGTLRGSMGKVVWSVLGAGITFATRSVLRALNRGIGK